jgi:hypothetical protein
LRNEFRGPRGLRPGRFAPCAFRDARRDFALIEVIEVIEVMEVMEVSSESSGNRHPVIRYYSQRR